MVHLWQQVLGEEQQQQEQEEEQQREAPDGGLLGSVSHNTNMRGGGGRDRDGDYKVIRNVIVELFMSPILVTLEMCLGCFDLIIVK